MPEEIKEHPAARAAKMIKELHEQNVKRIDSGTVFTKKNDDGTVEDVTALIYEKSLEQMDVCDQIIARAPNMPASLSGDAFMILKDLEDLKEKRMKLAPDEIKLEEASIPEIGNYDHKEGS